MLSAGEPKEATPHALFVYSPSELSSEALTVAQAALPAYSFELCTEKNVEKVVAKLIDCAPGQGFELLCGFGVGCDVVCGVLCKLVSLEAKLPQSLRKFALFGQCGF